MINNLKNLSGWYVNIEIVIEDPECHLRNNMKNIKCKTGIINDIAHGSGIIVINMSMDLPNGRFSDVVNTATSTALTMFFEEFPDLLGNSGEANISVVKELENDDNLIIPWLNVSSLNNFNEVLKDFTKQVSSNNFIYTF